MTVVYTHEVATGSKGFGNFGKLLLRWKGSIYKLVIPDLCVYSILYVIVSLIYRLWLSGLDDTVQEKKMFHLLVDYCNQFSSLIPLQFVLGFYVSQIVTRWWSQFMTIPWPDTLAAVVATSIHGHDDRGRMMRRTIMRYINLTLTMTFTMISSQARTRFPTMEQMVEAGFLVPHERLIIEHLNEKSEGPKYWVPIIWAGAVASKARKEGRIRDDVALYHVIKELCRFRNGCGDLLSYDWVCIPIVYTQVVTLCAYVYFTACLLGKQFIRSQTEDSLDLYVPVFHFLEFFFLMGWLKVAETMVNPFGEDDDDFEVNWLIDRNFTVAYLIVDEMNSEFPEMVKDAYWDGVVPDELPYNQASLKYKKADFQGSAAIKDQEDQSDYQSRRGEGSLLAGSLAGVGGHSVMKKASLPFSLPFRLGNKGKDKDGQKHDGTSEANMFDLAQSDRLQKNKPNSKNSSGDIKPERKSYEHLMEKSYVPRKKDSSDDMGRLEDGSTNPKGNSSK